LCIVDLFPGAFLEQSYFRRQHTRSQDQREIFGMLFGEATADLALVINLRFDVSN
jgi:hypothetical protein